MVDAAFQPLADPLRDADGGPVLRRDETDDPVLRQDVERVGQSLPGPFGRVAAFLARLAREVEVICSESRCSN